MCQRLRRLAWCGNSVDQTSRSAFKGLSLSRAAGFDSAVRAARASGFGVYGSVSLASEVFRR